MLSVPVNDIGFILTNYLEIYEERAAKKYYPEIYGVENFTRLSSGAILLGIDCKNILFPFEKSKNKVIQILQNEIESQEKSRLINQIIETNRNISFDEVLTISIHTPSQITLSETVKLAVGCAKAERLTSVPKIKEKTFI